MKLFLKYVITLIVLLLLEKLSFCEVIQGEISLNGKWKFSVGDNPAWAMRYFNDSGWDEIYAPENWEAQGFRRYDGYAWYRKKIAPGRQYANRIIVLKLGYIDDVDEVFVNGIKVGQSGSFPPDYSPGAKSNRAYLIPNDVLHFGEENTIAIRVFDAQLDGGIVRGDMKVEFSEYELPFDINLAGEWFLNPGKQVDPISKKPVIVPGLWENQGFFDYDGYAVYSKNIYVPENLDSEKLVFMAGRIDDVDRVFINGELIGSTGKYEERISENNYLEYRNYFILDGIIIPGQNNTIEVRVWDERWDGGIVEGPIGIITQDKFRKYWMSKRRRN